MEAGSLARSDQSRKATAWPGPWQSPAFWAEVEQEISGINWDEFLGFLYADEVPLQPSPEFETELRGRLKSFIRRRRDD